MYMWNLGSLVICLEYICIRLYSDVELESVNSTCTPPYLNRARSKLAGNNLALGSSNYAKKTAKSKQK